MNKRLKLEREEQEFMNDIVLEMKGIEKSFPGVKALDGVNLQVRSGEVHVICGENGAGKSTLMKVINGAYVADAGEVVYKGEVLGKRDIKATIDMGIAMIHQELSPLANMTIAENIYIGREPRASIKSFVDYKKMYSDARALLDSLNINYDAKTRMGDLSIAGQQQVEIAKAISQNASIIIMDEPSSAIADTEVEMLFNQIFDLRDKGVGIIYITHKMDEIFKIADTITVIRDGKWIESGPASDYTPDKLISLMVGRTISNIFPKEETEIGEVIMEVKNLTGKKFKNVSFKLRKGEILGFSGLVGAGRSEVMQAIFGLDPLYDGEIYLEGKKMNFKNTSDAIKHGIAMLSEDRRGFGIIPERSVRDNTTIVNLDKFQKAKIFVDEKKEMEEVQRMIKLLNVKVPGPEHLIKNLSGGNQQKVVLAKWLLGDLKVLILDEPTRGIDVGAKSEIHKLMSQFAKQGLAVIMISSELPEILGMSDRVIIMQEGIVSGELDRKEATQESIMSLATRRKENE